MEENTTKVCQGFHEQDKVMHVSSHFQYCHPVVVARSLPEQSVIQESLLAAKVPKAIWPVPHQTDVDRARTPRMPAGAQ